MYLDEEKSRVIACEIGYAVLMLLKKGEPVSQENISFLLENKRTEVDDVLHKLLLKGTAQLIRNGLKINQRVIKPMCSVRVYLKV